MPSSRPAQATPAQVTPTRPPRARFARARRTRATLVAAAVALTLLATACGADDRPAASGGDAAEAGGTAWTYTDARGTTIRRPARPERIIAHASAAAALIPLGIKPVGIFGDEPMEQNLVLDGLDLDGITSVGQVWGEVNVEKIAGLKPDLVVTGYYPLEKEVGGIDPEHPKVVENIEALAPIATVDNAQSAKGLLEDYVALGGKLGADLDTPRIAAARSAFDEAIGDFKTAVREKPGLSVTVISATDELYVANPPDFPELIDFESWGLRMTVPTNVEARGYFAQYSWERIDEVSADLVYNDARPVNAWSRDKLAKTQPLWNRLPAVKAGQVADWYTDTFTSYAAYTKHLRHLTKAIRAADPGLVD